MTHFELIDDAQAEKLAGGNAGDVVYDAIGKGFGPYDGKAPYTAFSIASSKNPETSNSQKNTRLPIVGTIPTTNPFYG